MSGRTTSPVVSAGVAGVVVTVATRLLGRRTRSSPRWQRSNYRGRTVSLAAGPALVLGASVAAAVSGAPGAATIGVAAAGLGLYDDLYGDSHARGLRGHVAALRAGRVTTGAVKMAGLVAAAAATSGLERRRWRQLPGDVVLVAGTANLVNLLDLRPGRALKAAGATCAGLVAGPGRAVPVAAATLGAALAAAPGDLGERSMIGDCGANGLGALVGWCLSRGLRPAPRAVAAAAVVGLTLASERISFTALIERTPALAALDALGRHG